MWSALSGLTFVVAVGVVGQPATLSRAETAKRVTLDLAARLKVAADTIRIDAESDEMWPDSTLGCGGKPLTEPQPVPGFSFALSYQSRRFVYHTDRRGRLRRCDTPKPVDPIRRR